MSKKVGRGGGWWKDLGDNMKRNQGCLQNTELGVGMEEGQENWQSAGGKQREVDNGEWGFPACAGTEKIGAERKKAQLFL